LAQWPEVFQLEAPPADRDYGRYGLRRPGPGQEWIRVGNDYVLVSILSGIILGAIVAH